MEKEFYEIDSKNAWAQAFQQIRSESGNYNFTYKDARKAENKNLNRYRDVNPYDHSRVRLSKGDKDYINASFVEIPAARRAYILTQGPLPITTGHFWLMIWEQKSKAVLMLNRVIEKNTVKCHQYWPLGSHHGGEDEMVFKDVNLKVTICGEKEGENYTVRELLVSNLDIEESGSTDTVNVQKVLLEMRKYRMGLIQTPDQLRFSYLAIIEGAKQILADQKISEYVPSKGVYELPDGVFEEKQINNNESEKPKKNIIEAENCEEVTTPETSVSEVNRRITETNDAKTEPPPLPPRNKPFSDIPIEKNFSEATQMSPNSVTSENVVSFKASEDLREADIPREEDEVVADDTSSLRENSITDAEIRKRRRKERLEKTAETVQKMRRKQQDSESWARRRLLLKQFSIGLVLLLGTGVLVYRYYVKS
ncbi:tyrosine-protein phosphatase non-receptor type 1-like isoform X3 [Tachypleus tridentatus]|uniref:tyrosine-protein phosphatase non-receptor type 1-like isoform X3 n=1 Tax=Tachypleus tridentatus TaxID=6853 RepID=UPI003FCFF417